MKSGDVFLLKLRGRKWLFDYMILEDVENRYELLGRLILCHSN